MSEAKEEKYRRIGWVTSLTVQLLMLLLFYFLIAWREPDPPIPSYGIELSFGTTQTTDEFSEDSSEPIDEVQEEEVLPSEEEIIEETVEAEPVETESETTPNEFVEPIVDEPTPDVNEVKVVETPKEQVKDAVEKKVEVKKDEEVKKVEEPKPEVKTESTTKDVKTPASTTNTSPKSGDNAPVGDAGNPGDPEGSLDARALMGQKGNSDGASLQMSGWVWDMKPEPNDNSTETGVIVYEITVDEDGYITGIKKISSTISPVVELKYRQSVERLSFSQTNEYKPANSSTGRITFVIRAK